MNNAKFFKSTPLIFVLGAAVGLGLGLLIGWGLWPVEWEGATLRDLDEAGKAQYIAAVADAFVMYDTPEAATLAQQRLAPLQENLDAEFVAAIRYFQNNPQAESVIRISNIGRLASTLGMVPPDLQASSTNPAQAGAVAENPAASSVATATAETTNATNNRQAISWWRWLLWLVAALLLLGGGFYLLGAAGFVSWQPLLERITSAINRRPPSEVDEFDEEVVETTGNRYPRWPDDRHRNTFVSEGEDLAFADEDAEEDLWQYQPPTRPQRPDDWADEAHGPQRFSTDDYDDEPGVVPTVDSILAGGNRRPSGATLGSGTTAEEDLPWDEDDAVAYDTDEDDSFDEEPVDEDRFANVTTAYRARLEQEPRPAAEMAAMPSDESADKFDDDDFDDDDFDDDGLGDDTVEGNIGDEDDDFADEKQEMHTPPSSFSQFRVDSAGNVVSRHDETPMATPNQRPATAHAPTTKSTAADQLPPAKAAPVGTNNRRPGHKLIDQHRLQYRLGITDYDESKPIVDPDSGKYVGEFGMGTSTKNGVVQPNGDYVAALEVWLFDKSDEKHMGNQTRILLSEFAVDHNLEQSLTRERTDNPRPFTPQQGVHFQLESQNLLLDCTVVDVTYIDTGSGKGMFQSINVDMSVHQKR